jgi:hypothetical protein
MNTHHKSIANKINELKERCGVKTLQWNKLTNYISNLLLSMPWFNEWDTNIIEEFDKSRYEQESFQVPFLTKFNEQSLDNLEKYYITSFNHISHLKVLKEKRNDILLSLHTKNIVQFYDYLHSWEINFYSNNENYDTILVNDLWINLKEVLINDFIKYKNELEGIWRKPRKIKLALHCSVAQIQTMWWCLSVIEKICDLIQEWTITNEIQINKAIESISKDLLFIAINYPIWIYSQYVDIFVDFWSVENWKYPFIKEEGFKYNSKTSELLINPEIFSGKPPFCNTETMQRIHRWCPFAFFKDKKWKWNMLILIISHYLNLFKKSTIEQYYPHIFQD